jgi:hypothetical protein
MLVDVALKIAFEIGLTFQPTCLAIKNKKVKLIRDGVYLSSWN